MNPLILVNGQHAYPADTAQDLIPVHANYPDILLEQEAAQALTRLMDNGPAFTEQFVARPGHSEHQTGLAIDLGLRQQSIDFIRPEFPYEGICQQFRQQAPSFGFIERYPKGKERITGIAHEPWHFRYVGTPHSERMAGLGLTLEEYLA